MKTTPTQRIHLKSDFSLLFRFAEGRPDCPWDLTFSTDGRFLSSSFSCSFDGQKYTHCAPVEGTADCVLIAFDNHRLGSGPLSCRLHRAQPDALFSDGVRDQVDILPTSVVLWEGPSDEMTTPPEVTALLLPMLTGPAGPSAYAAAAANGYPGDEASFNQALSEQQVYEQVAGSSVSLDLAGGRTYLCGELTSLTLSTVEDSPRESVVRFRSGAVATSVTVPQGLRRAGLWAFESGRWYELSVASGLAILVRYE